MRLRATSEPLVPTTIHQVESLQPLNHNPPTMKRESQIIKPESRNNLDIESPCNKKGSFHFGPSMAINQHLRRGGSCAMRFRATNQSLVPTEPPAI